ncbi:Transcriptional regulatory protein pro1 [Madurella mycetomatis]|uniref:Transcriptional regulatory protein pro1 n=1 Tax=Madurella mycetomatis TaxID=100816 RepID=A0A175W7C9_9PEZI|nr:Transcriptional regulatory protein pro1 [Madurella mycetomatis]
MSTKTRSAGGCWTCRLRRKKCDEARPLCSGCAALEIDCLYSNDRPKWMDGAERQKQRAEWLKSEVKRKATYRRERRHLQGIEVRLESLDASLADESDTAGPKDSLDIMPASANPGPPSYDDPQNLTPRSESIDLQTCSSASIPSPDKPAGGSNTSSLDLEGMLAEDKDAHLTMIYLDYVFPFVFPFYRPSVLDVGRGWLLALLTKNKALFHSALGLAGYFYAALLGSAEDSPHECQAQSLETLHRQQGLALQWLQHEMHDIITRGVKDQLAEASRVMASIIQLLTCEIAIARPGNWTIHLAAATELYSEIMKQHGTREGHTCFMLVLLQLGSRPFTWTPRKHPWGLNQAIVRFFTAQLLFIDTLASTALQQPPRLQQWHQHLLFDYDEETKKKIRDSEKEQTTPHINLEEFVGVQNWAILAISEISALDSWKKGMKRAGSLSVTELMSRATDIEQHLRASLQALLRSDAKDASPSTPNPFSQCFAGGFSLARVMHGIGLNTQIWAQAALTYLNVILSGWQPASCDIRKSVTQTVELLLSLPNPDCLRTVVWPFVVTGCLAAPDQEFIFRDMVSAMGPLQRFGTISDGLAILEHVWAHRVEIDENPDQWDLAACLNCLGRPVLLI